VGRFLAFICLLAALAIGAAWYSQQPRWTRGGSVTATAGVSEEWLEHIYSQNPGDVEKAEATVRRLGARALPAIQAALRDPQSNRAIRKAAIKGCVILEQQAAEAIPEVAAQLDDPELTAEAALALSLMGAEAFTPLRDALDSPDPLVRKEALRSIGKLKERGPLDSAIVLPILLDRMHDPDKDVRIVAATYLGILHESPARSVPALIDGLTDENPEVRRASATALGSFEEGAEEAIPELRKAARDRDPDLAREAGLALLKLRKQ
jgi:HEAT repeat protein